MPTKKSTIRYKTTGRNSNSSTVHEEIARSKFAVVRAENPTATSQRTSRLDEEASRDAPRDVIFIDDSKIRQEAILEATEATNSLTAPDAPHDVARVEYTITGEDPPIAEVPIQQEFAPSESKDSELGQSQSEEGQGTAPTSLATSEQIRERSPSPKKRILTDELEAGQPLIKKVKGSDLASGVASNSTRQRFPSPPNQAATAFDKESWQGYCNIESDPAYFSVILRKIGVQGITIREVPSLDDDTLTFLPQPIYGLILLFRHRYFDTSNQKTDCPKNVWFANQMPGHNSCATLAMTHTLLNISCPDIDIGEHMQQFYNFSKDLTPFHRGEAFASWRFVKKIHNAFATKMDMLECDKYLAAKVQASQARKCEIGKGKKKVVSKRGGGRKRQQSEEALEAEEINQDIEESAHHYIAFVPINGTVWKLDGMDKQPTIMGSYDKATPNLWIQSINHRLMELMAAGDDDYGVFAVAQSPLVKLRRRICVEYNTAKRVEQQLAASNPDWKDFISGEEDALPSLTFLGNFSEQERAAIPVPEIIVTTIMTEDIAILLSRWSASAVELRRLAVEWSVEEGQEIEEDSRAQQRTFDYGPAIRKWLGFLAENGTLEKNLQLFM